MFCGPTYRQPEDFAEQGEEGGHCEVALVKEGIEWHAKDIVEP